MRQNLQLSVKPKGVAVAAVKVQTILQELF